MRKFFALMLALIMTLSLVACGGETAAEDPTPEADQTEQQGDAAPEVEEEPEEPAKVLEPIVYTGSGDDVIEIASIVDGYVFHITGNEAGRHFSVTAYDANSEYLDLLVNTSDPYEGVTMEDTFTAAMLEISAEGSWTVELMPGNMLSSYTAGDTITGSGDMIFCTDGQSKTAEISGNEASRHFAVIGYGDYGMDLLVNTTDPYSGKVMLNDNPVVWKVTSEGAWTIILN